MTNFEALKRLSLDDFSKAMWSGFTCGLCAYYVPKEDAGYRCKGDNCRKAFAEWLNEEVKEEVEE